MTQQHGSRTGTDVTAELTDGIATVTIRRPETLNSINAQVLDDLGELIGWATQQPAARVIVLRGEGRAFCSGADLGAGAGPDDLTPTLDAADGLIHAIRDSPLPVVAAVHGPCAGFGVSIALAADLTIASSKAFFMLAFTKVGLMPDGGASALVAASVGRQTAMRMALLAERLPADEAAALGLVAATHDHEEFEDRLAETLRTLADGARGALARTKHAVNAATLTALDPALDLERAGQTVLLSAPDFAEGVAAFGDKRAPRFTDPATSA